MILLCFSVKFIYIYFKKSFLSINEIIIESKEFNYLEEIKNKFVYQVEGKILKEISVINHIYAKKVNEYKMKKNIIHITEALNNNELYKYVTLVSLYSILLNCNKKRSFIIVHILCTPDFDDSSTIIFIIWEIFY